jgi:ABC-2 type transport system permease protein
VLFASLQGGRDLLHATALWTSAFALVLAVVAACERWHFAGFSKAQEARKARFTRLRLLDVLIPMVPLTAVRRHLLIKDVKVFLRDVSQWSQLMLLVALVLVYLYNFRVLDLERIKYMSGVVKNVYALVNLGMAGFVMATVSARFAFPAVSAEGQAFWIIRTAPIRLGEFLWSKFWSALLPVLLLTETLTVVANGFLGIDPFLKIISAIAIVFMTVALVGMATGPGARYPRFNADSPTQVAGSYGGITFMILAVFYVLVAWVLVGWPSSVYLWHRSRGAPLWPEQRWMMAASYGAAAVLSLVICWVSMRSGVRALEEAG